MSVWHLNIKYEFKDIVNVLLMMINSKNINLTQEQYSEEEQLMLFRIEDISGFNPKLRTYNTDEFTTLSVNKEDIDKYLALKIREEINGSKCRELLSYSKSLATCILKYNKYTDNELHICNVNGCIDYISYISSNNTNEYIGYSIQNRIHGNPLFYESGKIDLSSFIIDVSNNTLVDKYFRIYTEVGKKIFSSPEKDSEVVVMNPPDDMIINQYIDAVYILYALQLRYRFLNDKNVQYALMFELKNMDAFRFEYCPQERYAFIILIQYLSVNWEYEHKMSREIYKYSENEEHFPMHYDMILQFHGIMQDDFEDSYNLSTYNDNVISDLFWRYCGRYLGYDT